MDTQNNRLMILTTSLVAASFMSYDVLAQNSNDSGEADANYEEIVVTGTRIKGAAPTSHTVTFSREDIDARGFNGVEDILAALPQNFSGVNSSTTSLGGSNPGASVGTSQRFQGQALANLRGLGESNVLILVNGRRQAGSGDADIQSLGAVNGVNLNSIPFSAIERVDVMLDGASAIYGADAIGGVINFILRKNYSGLEVTARYDEGKNGGDNVRYGASFGHTWGTGSLTLSGSFSDSDPVSASEAGFTTLNRIATGGVDGRASGSPAFIYEPGAFGATGQFFPGDDGTTPLSADDLNLITGRLSTDPFGIPSIDNVPIHLAAQNDNVAFSLGFQQQLNGENLELYSDIQYSKDETNTVATELLALSQGFPGFGIPADVTIPTSNAFNDTGLDLRVRSTLFQEALSGVVPLQTTETGDERLGVVAGLIYRPNDNWTIDFSAGVNRSETTYVRLQSQFDPVALQLLADSSDPSVAFNPFGDGSAQNDLSSAIFRGPSSDSLTSPSESKSENLMVTAEGRILELPGGDLRMAFGAEYREESLELHGDFLSTSGDPLQGLFATASPSRDLLAGFFEASIPLVGENNRKPGIRALQLNLSGRVDSYDAKASTMTTEINNSYEEFSPRVGIAWSPIERFQVRANWTEAFRPPTMTQLFQADRFSSNFPAFFFYFGNPGADPFAPPGSDPAVDGPPSIELRDGPNNALEGETSESWSVGFNWNLPILDDSVLSINYNETEISNQFQRTSTILFDGQLWADLGFGPEGPGNGVERNAAGFITTMTFVPININGTTSRSLDYLAGFGVDSSSAGYFGFEWAATQTLETERNILGVVSRLDDSDLGLPEWVHQASINWTKNNYGATFAINHTGSYDNLAGVAQILGRPTTARDVDEQGLAEKVDSYTTYDLTGRYTFEDVGLEVSAGVINLTDEDFPYYNNQFGAPFDLRHVDPRGRRVFVNLRMNFDL